MPQPQEHQIIHIVYWGNMNVYHCECGFVAIEINDDHFTGVHPRCSDEDMLNEPPQE